MADGQCHGCGIRTRFCSGIYGRCRDLCDPSYPAWPKKLLSGQRQIWLYQPIGCFYHRLFYHAAKAQSGCRRAGTGKAWPYNRDLLALLTVLKGLPLAYGKDMQEDKEPVFDAEKPLYRLALPQ